MHLSTQEHGGSALFILVAAFLATYFMLTFYNPDFVQRKVNGRRTGVNDQVVTMGWALVISLAVLFLLGIILYAFSCYQ
tara:strand:+ start:1283 stop:1519 length:237 start_codon:yes stop_codon:yes gene_type:complete